MLREYIYTVLTTGLLLELQLYYNNLRMIKFVSDTLEAAQLVGINFTVSNSVILDEPSASQVWRTRVDSRTKKLYCSTEVDT